MTLEKLITLSPYDIERNPVPLKQLLQDSLYYPACDLDGGLIRYCNQHFSQLGICCFVYADYATGEERLLEHLDEFRGYHLVAHRRLGPGDVGADKPLVMPEYINPEEYLRYRFDWKPFAHWSVYERDADFGDGHGPRRFSLLFLGAEGVAAYAGLYHANDITPKAIALIQPGHGFGLNWTNFFDWNSPLAITVKRGTSMPEFLFFGGLGSNCYDDCPWPDYRWIDQVDHYYRDIASSLTVWQYDQAI